MNPATDSNESAVTWCWTAVSQAFVNFLLIVCGGELSATSRAGYLYSHAKHGDHNYDNKENCVWRITASDSSHRIRFRFLTFEVEDEADCGWDKFPSLFSTYASAAMPTKSTSYLHMAFTNLLMLQLFVYYIYSCKWMHADHFFKTKLVPNLTTGLAVKFVYCPIII